MRIVLIGLKIHPSLSMQRNSVGTLASVGAMVIVIMHEIFGSVHGATFKNGRLKLLFCFYACTSSEWCDTAYTTWDNVFCLYPSMYNCPLKGSEGSQVNIVTLHRQTSNGGTAGLRRSKRLLDSKLQTRATQ